MVAAFRGHRHSALTRLGPTSRCMVRQYTAVPMIVTDCIVQCMCSREVESNPHQTVVFLTTAFGIAMHALRTQCARSTHAVQTFVTCRNMQEYVVRY